MILILAAMLILIGFAMVIIRADHKTDEEIYKQWQIDRMKEQMRRDER